MPVGHSRTHGTGNQRSPILPQQPFRQCLVRGQHQHHSPVLLHFPTKMCYFQLFEHNSTLTDLFHKELSNLHPHSLKKKKKRHFLKAKRKKSVTSVPCSPLPFVDRAFLMVSNSDITGQGGEAPTPQVLSFSHNQLPQHCLWQLAAGLRAGKRRDQQPLLTSWPCAPIPRLAQLHLSARGTGLSPTSGSSLINTGQNIHVSHSCPSAQPNNITEPQQGSCRHKKLPAMKQGIKYSLQKNTVSVSTCSCKLNPVSTHFELHETTP